MNVLWDFRLFSWGYRDRGVGVWCANVAASILKARPDFRLFIWGDRAAVPAALQSGPHAWIPYRKGSWKSGMFIIPWLSIRHRIDLLHYWVALGPLQPIGIAPWCACPSIASVHDLGVELWETPHCRTVRGSAYWTMQKRLFGSIDALLVNSAATLQDIARTLSPFPKTNEVVYMPPSGDVAHPAAVALRRPFFITLGGSLHKNCSRVVQAFSRVRHRHPGYRLVILGVIDSLEESLAALPEGVTPEPSMEHYGEYLRTCGGLLYCSLYEGLGIPPIEAMAHGCPLLLSDIPPLRETCSGAADFIDPRSIESIERGIEELIADPAGWAARSAAGAQAYRSLSGETPGRCLRMYEQLTGSAIIRQGRGITRASGGRP